MSTSNASIESLPVASSIRSVSTMSTSSDSVGSIEPPIPILSFYQHIKTQTVREVPNQNHRHGQGNVNYQTTTRTVEVAIETSATVPDVMYSRKVIKAIPPAIVGARNVADLPAVVARHNSAGPLAVAATAANPNGVKAPGLQAVLNRFFKPNRGFAPGRNASAGPSRQQSHRSQSAKAAEPKLREYTYVYASDEDRMEVDAAHALLTATAEDTDIEDDAPSTNRADA